MKNKKYTTEDKIRILRQVDSGKSVAEVCQENNLSQVSFYRWKKQFGQMEVNEAKLALNAVVFLKIFRDPSSGFLDNQIKSRGYI